MRIDKVSISNYRSLGDNVEIAFSQVNVLVGQNGAGKSNIIDALAFLRDAVNLGLSQAILERGGIASVRRHSDGKPYDVKVGVSLSAAGAQARYEITITSDRADEYRVKREIADVKTNKGAWEFRRDQTWTSNLGIELPVGSGALALTALAGDERFSPIAETLRGIATYAIFPDRLREPQKFDPEPLLKRQGENWVSVLRAFERDDALKARFMEGLQVLVPQLEDFRVQSAAGYLVAEFRRTSFGQRKGRWLPASLESDGTLRVAGLLTAMLQARQMTLLAIEEPELTIHPGALQLVYDYLMEAGHSAQVLVTSHSPEFLDHFEPVGADENADGAENPTAARIYVVERHEGATQLKAMEQTHLSAVRDHLMTLGEMLAQDQLTFSFISNME